MNIKPTVRYADARIMRVRQETPRSLLDSLKFKAPFPVGGSKERGFVRAQQIDTNVRTPRALVDESLIRANL